MHLKAIPRLGSGQNYAMFIIGNNRHTKIVPLETKVVKNGRKK